MLTFVLRESAYFGTNRTGNTHPAPSLIMKTSTTNIGTFIDLRRNWAFKTIFGTTGNEDLLLALVQAILPDKNITGVTLIPTEKMGVREDSRSAVFDISCETSSGDFISVEMQFSEQDDFGDRMMFYSSFPIFNSLSRGGTSYAFKAPVYIIGILNFILPGVVPNDRLINQYRMLNTQDARAELSGNLTCLTLELPKFSKTLKNLETLADKLFYTLAHISEMKERPDSFSEIILEKLFERCSFASMTYEQQYAYIRSIMAEVDERSRLRTAVNKALAEDRAEVARALREKGISPSVIAEACGITENEIRNL